MEESKFEYIWKNYLDGSAIGEERQELMRWIAQKENELSIKMKIQLELERINEGSVEITNTLSPTEAEEVFRGIVASKEMSPVIEMGKRSIFKRRTLLIAAAVVIFISIGVGLFVYYSWGPGPAIVKKTLPQNNDILPGRDGAILTLADGRTLVLDNAGNGKLTDVAVKNGNQLSYANGDASKAEYNTMTTPKGRQFQLVLADGTRVWLNAASSITFPTAFLEKERSVQITGEAYFEVAHDESKPFHVTVNGVDVEVLGTHFNINAYNDEAAIKATLLQGSIKVSSAADVRSIIPGEQARIDDGQIRLVKDVDVDEVMAWKNGYFSFNDADIKTVMRQLSRWYDIQVSYEGNNDETFSGKIDRNLSLNDLLNGLGQTKVHYRIEENGKVVILP